MYCNNFKLNYEYFDKFFSQKLFMTFKTENVKYLVDDKSSFWMINYYKIEFSNYNRKIKIIVK